MVNFGRIWLIARREWLSRVRERTFRIATIFQIVITLIAACLPTIISRFEGSSSPDSVTIGVINEAGVDLDSQFEPYFADTSSSSGTRYSIVPLNLAPLQAEQQVDSGGIDAVLVVARDQAGALTFAYYNADGDLDTVAQQVYVATSALTIADQLQKLGVSADQFNAATAPPNFSVSGVTVTGASDDDSPTGAEIAIAYICAILMFMVIQLYGNWIAQGVVEEKSSRIMEIMINAATPRDLLGGKILGIGMAALTQLIPMLAIGGTAFALQPRLADALDVSTTSAFSEIDFGSISIRLVGFFSIYFLVGFILYASLFAAVASLLSRQEDVNSAVAPLTMAMMVGYIGATFTIPIPNNTISKVLSIFPLTSPFNMVSRTVTSDVPAWQIAVSIALLLITAIAGVLLAGRIYKVGVLMYGQKATVRSVFKRGVQSTAR
ncbi:ABC transporter permease [soil metagenome]